MTKSRRSRPFLPVRLCLRPTPRPPLQAFSSSGSLRTKACVSGKAPRSAKNASAAVGFPGDAPSWPLLTPTGTAADRAVVPESDRPPLPCASGTRPWCGSLCATTRRTLRRRLPKRQGPQRLFRLPPRKAAAQTPKRALPTRKKRVGKARRKQNAVSGSTATIVIFFTLAKRVPACYEKHRINHFKEKP